MTIAEDDQLKKSGFRTQFIIILIVCVLVLATALYMEFGMLLEPCLLCMSQRIMYLAIAFMALLGALHNPALGGHRRYGVFICLFAIAGAILAIRQLYLQNLPPDLVPECGPGFSYMLNSFPLYDLVINMLKGSGSCAEVQWSLFGLSIPAWSLVVFCLIAAYGAYLSLCQTKIMILGK